MPHPLEIDSVIQDGRRLSYRRDGNAFFVTMAAKQPKGATRTVTVSVPFGPRGETLVTFYNRVKLAKIKVCKVIPITSQDSLDDAAKKRIMRDNAVQLMGRS